MSKPIFAKQNVVCKEKHSVIYVMSINVPESQKEDFEFDELKIWYCPICNCSWTEV